MQSNTSKIVLAVIVTAIIVGGGVYVWQRSILKSSEQSSQQQITSLENQINQQKEETNNVVKEGEIAPVETADWNNYNNSKYLYSVKYPNSWFNLPNYGAPDTDKYFSNKNVGSPLEMGSDGIWITIIISENNDNLSLSEWASKTPGSSHKISNVRNVVINGVPAIQQVEDFTKAEDTEGGYSLATYLMKGKTVYSIKSLTFNSTTSDNYKEEYNLMVGSFVLKD